jgi:VWFA-related protein
MLSLLLVAYAASLPAQEGHFGENVDVHLVGIDAVVTDAHGNRVHGLTADDVEILEGSRPQDITNFSEYRSGAAQAQQDREPHSLLILIDLLPPQGRVRQTVFRQLEEALPKLMAAGDHVSVVYWEPGLERSREVIESTDPAKVDEAIRALDAATPVMHVDIREVAGREAGLMFLERKTAAMERLVNAIGVRPGRKAVLYISNDFGFAGERPNYTTAKIYVDRVSAAANANGVMFYAAEPVCSSTALPRITEATGGLLGFSRFAVAELAPKMEEDLESYYSVAYRARSDGLDHERKVTIKAKNPKYSVRTRTTIVEKSNAAKARDLVVSRLFGDEGGTDIRFDVVQEPIRQGARAGQWLLPIVVKIPAAQVQFVPGRDKPTAHVGILVASANGVAEVTPITTNDLSVTEKDLENGFITYSFEIVGDKRGSKVSIGVADRSTGAVGVQTLDSRPASRRVPATF